MAQVSWRRGGGTRFNICRVGRLFHFGPSPAIAKESSIMATKGQYDYVEHFEHPIAIQGTTKTFTQKSALWNNSTNSKSGKVHEQKLPPFPTIDGSNLLESIDGIKL
jgi:hypothetical protein